MKQTLWMKLSKDAYELPVAIADTKEELAKKCGVTVDAINKGMRNKRRKSYIKVEVEEC